MDCHFSWFDVMMRPPLHPKLFRAVYKSAIHLCTRLFLRALVEESPQK